MKKIPAESAVKRQITYPEEIGLRHTKDDTWKRKHNYGKKIARQRSYRGLIALVCLLCLLSVAAIFFNLLMFFGKSFTNVVAPSIS